MSRPIKQPYVVFLRKDSPFYWMRFSLPGHGQHRIALKTEDPEEAERLAEEKYRHAVWSAEHGILPGKTSFSKVAREYLDYAEKLGETSKKAKERAKADKGVIERYFIPFFGKMTITSIHEPKLNEYVSWRTSYWISGPGKDATVVRYERDGKTYSRPARHVEPTLSTLRREAVALRAVFKHAARLGYIKRSEIPKMELAAETRNKRPSFTDAEVEHLLVLAQDRINDIGNRNAKRNKERKPCDWTPPTDFENRIRYERMMLYCFVNIALATGMRPTELHNLRWANIVGFAAERKKPIAQRRIRIEAYGKGRQPQQLVPNVEAFGYFELLWQSFKTRHVRDPELTDAVFANADGSPAQSFKKSLNELLTKAGLKKDAFGRPRSAYSFRHTYASNQLRKGTDVYTLAINMRTSVRMIEMYYSDVVPDDLARKLEGDFA